MRKQKKKETNEERTDGRMQNEKRKQGGKGNYLRGLNVPEGNI
jgi:hypothetical protein